MFGVGGAEWLVIAGIAALLFVPGVAVFGLGYVLGRRTASSSGSSGELRPGSEILAPPAPPTERPAADD
jgi:hypothetical protein